MDSNTNGYINHAIFYLWKDRNSILERALENKRIRCRNLAKDWREENKKVEDADIHIMKLEMEVEVKTTEVNSLMEECNRLILLIEQRSCNP